MMMFYSDVPTIAELVDRSDDELFEKVWAIVFAISGMSEISTLFTFKCRIGLEEGFPVILRTIVPFRRELKSTLFNISFSGSDM